ncbi:MAG TPA: SHOCT domain-containing protein [Candidatus Limnocylindria bacterium]|nr:SHOCT domain-containing protein [Candidatus Limnocylindria bacterium]
MGISDELEKLRALHDSGELTDGEYERAKDAAIRGASADEAPARDHPEGASLLGGIFGGKDTSVGGAANRYVNFQIVSAVIGLILFLVFACAVLPNFNRPPGFGP